MLIRHGAPALSNFRRHKLSQHIILSTVLSLSIQADYYYFINLQDTLTPDNLSVLEQLLQASPDSTPSIRPVGFSHPSPRYYFSLVFACYRYCPAMWIQEAQLAE